MDATTNTLASTMLDFNNAKPQRPHPSSFDAAANDQAQQADGSGLPPRPVAPDDSHARRVQRDDARPRADDPLRAYGLDNWTLDVDASECRCAVCSSQDQ